MIAVLRIVPIVLEFILIYLNTTKLSPNSKFREYTYPARKVKTSIKQHQLCISGPKLPHCKLKLKVGKLVCILQLLSSLTLIHVSESNGYWRTARSQSTVPLLTTHLG